MVKLVVGTDEVASGKQRVEGYTYVLLPTSEAAALTQKTLAIQKEHGVDSFHGRTFDLAHAAAYEEFLHAVHDAVAKATPSMISVILYSAGERERITAASTGMMEVAYTGNRQNSRRLIEISRLFIPQLITLQRITAELGPNAVGSLNFVRGSL